ncbi:hypothetical protein [Phytohabitans rumicis]|uniref:Uncharacterized protein n=1 Tax=Phytohabitans rumicis TaxID=1076125 RepID=A0A6V8LEE3_9ACTN|nr:hypothetical protein [Phytohabitans rumicis]GFJ93181.1 hypothetical protein Prum_068230 [Phytohabitans rumicis]
MSIDATAFYTQQRAAFAAVHDVLGPSGAHVEFGTAGELAALMARLPAETTVFVAETVHIDMNLQLDQSPNRTAAAATVIPLGDENDLVHILDEGRPQQAVRLVPGVELGAYIVAEDAAGVPEVTVPFPPYERAVEALRDGDLRDVFAAQVELLNWMAATLTESPPSDDPTDDQNVSEWISDPELREHLGVEAERLRQAAARLAALGARAAAHRAAGD